MRQCIKNLLRYVVKTLAENIFPWHDAPMKTKSEAVALFGSPAKLAEALGLTTPQAIYAWPEQLKQYHIDRVVGAAIRTGRLPKRGKRAPSQEAAA